MTDRAWRILEAGAVAAMQQAVGTAFDRVKARLDTTAELRRRVETLETEMARLKKREKR